MGSPYQTLGPVAREAGTPLVSVLMATYQHAGFIALALEGCLMQKTTFPVEIIVHDDASTDGTVGIIRDYARTYPDRVLPILRETNIYSTGVKILPILLRQARGRYIAVCEGDDRWTDPEKLEKQVACLENNANVSVCYHQAVAVDEAGDSLERPPDTRCQLDATVDDLKRGFRIYTSTMFFRNVLGELPPEVDAGFGTDKFLTALLARHGSGKYLPDILPSHYRHHAGGVERSVIDPVQRYRNHLRTWMALYLFHQRIGDTATRDHYFQRVRETMDLIDPSAKAGEWPTEARNTLLRRALGRLRKR